MEGIWTLEILDLTEQKSYLLSGEHFTQEEAESSARARISDIQEGRPIRHLEGEKVFQSPLRLYIADPEFNKQSLFSSP